MGERGDEHGMFWDYEIRTVAKKNAPMPFSKPPVPETGWMRPANFPDLSSAKRIAVDVESHDPKLLELGPGFQRGDAYVVGVAIGTDNGYRGYFPIAHADSDNFERQAVVEWLNRELGRSTQEKVGANLYYDFEALQKEGVKIAGRARDVQIAEPLLDESRLQYNLESLAQDYLSEGKREGDMTPWAMRAFACSEKQVKQHMKDIPAKLVGPYAEGDVDLPLRILPLQEAKLKKEGLDILFDLESDLLYPLLRMRVNGVRIDTDKVAQLHDEFKTAYDAVIKDLGGINTDEASALVKLFDKEGIVYPKTEKGNPSFRKDWLEHHPHPICQKIVAARKYRVMLSTFIDGGFTNHATEGRIHARFNQLKGDEYGTVTGRLSSSDPNLQNIPIRDEILGPKIRGLFIPEDGCWFGDRDYSQVEYRLIVHFAAMYGCEGGELAAARYRNDRKTDFHEYVAELCGVKRKIAKNINFGLAYGQGVALLAYNLGISEPEARKILNQYHKDVPFVGELMSDMVREANTSGYITTLFNRKRRFNMWEKKGVYKTNTSYKMLPHGAAVHAWGEKNIQRARTYAAMNAKMQGSAADIMKKAMLDIWDAGLFEVLPMHLTVHDELGCSVPKTKEGEEAFVEMGRLMENCVKLRVPLLADGGLGANWAEAK